MYKDFFGFTELPFSIVPSSKYLYLSARHREAMNHLQSGLGEGGGFAMLTGEVDTGKTTVSKAMLSALGEETRAALILNPTYSSQDLLEAICDEFGIEYPNEASSEDSDSVDSAVPTRQP
jgi:general secretion pathway protein A